MGISQECSLLYQEAHKGVYWACCSLSYTSMIYLTFCRLLNLTYLLRTPNVYIISPPESDDILLQNNIDILTTYSNSWHLHFNEIKCVHLHFQFNSTSYIPKYYINNKEIYRKVETKDL